MVGKNGIEPLTSQFGVMCLALRTPNRALCPLSYIPDLCILLWCDAVVK